MKKHNIVLAVLACAAAVSLSACSKAKVPTVDELFAQPFGSAAVTSGDLDVKLTTSVTTQSGTTDVDLNVNSRFQNTVRYISGTEAGTTGGTAYNNKLESYLVADGGGVYQLYSLNSQTGRWEVSSSNGSDTIDTSTLLDLNKAIFSDLTVQDFKKGDSEYVVRGTISYADLKTLLGSMANKVPSTTDLGVLPATLRFDTTSKQLNSFMVLIEAPVGDINKFEFSYKVNNLNSTTVTLPDDVKNNAVPAGTEISDTTPGNSGLSEEDMEIQQIPENTVQVDMSSSQYAEFVKSQVYKDYVAAGNEVQMNDLGTAVYVPNDLYDSFVIESKQTSDLFKPLDGDKTYLDDTPPETVSPDEVDETSDAPDDYTPIEGGEPVGDGRIYYHPDAEFPEDDIMRQIAALYPELEYNGFEDHDAVLDELGLILGWGEPVGDANYSVSGYCKATVAWEATGTDVSTRYKVISYLIKLGCLTYEQAVGYGLDSSKLR